MKLQYNISFYEDIEENFTELSGDELELFKLEVEKTLVKYLTLAGAQVNDFKLEFDIEEEVEE